MLKKILYIIGLVVLIPAVCIAGKVNVRYLNKAKWIYFETESFIVLTDAREETALEIVRELEHFKYFLSAILRYEPKPLSEKVTVLAAKNEISFKALGVGGNYGGFFLGENINAIFARCDGFRASSRENLGRHIIFHELTHLFLHNLSSEISLPPWYDEGMAEYFGTYFEWNGKVIIGDLKIVKNRFYSMLKNHHEYENVDTESLFKTTNMDLHNVEAGKQNEKFINKFYARAFMVIHYLFGDIDHTKKLTQYLFSLYQGISVDDSFKQAFDMTFEEFDKEINRYIHQKQIDRRFYYPDKMGIGFPVVDYKRHGISKRDAFAYLFTHISMISDKILGDGNYEKFIRDLEKIHPGIVDVALKKQLAEKPENSTALLRLAKIYSKVNKCHEAIALYEKAVVLEADDATILNNYSWFLVTMTDLELRNPVRAIELAKRAVAIERTPSFLDTLAEAYYANGSYQKAIETINEAISLTREDSNYMNKQLEKFKKAQEKL